MEHYLSMHMGPIPVKDLFTFALHHRKTPAQITELIVNAKTDNDDHYLLKEVPEVSAETWIAVRDRILADGPHVDYVTYDQRSPELRRAVRNSLDRLGGTADEVAESLRHARIQGEQDEECWCPVAVYLRMLFKTDAVSVGYYGLSVNGVSLETPHQISSFIGEMDRLEYPDLKVGPIARRSYLPDGG